MDVMLFLSILLNIWMDSSAIAGRRMCRLMLVDGLSLQRQVMDLKCPSAGTGYVGRKNYHRHLSSSIIKGKITIHKDLRIVIFELSTDSLRLCVVN